jgi:hypothetical protein
VRALFAGVMPEPLGRIEIGRIGRKWKHCDLPVMFGKKFQDFGLLVIRGIVLDQIYPMVATIIMREQCSVDERQISLGVEVFGLVPPDEIAGGHADGPQDLLRVAFAARGNLRLLATPRPSPIKSGCLSKGRFILINDQRPFFPGVFFRLGCV